MDFQEVFEAWERRHPRETLPTDKDLESGPTFSRQQITKMPVEAQLDLHGLLQEEAVARVRTFLKTCHAQGRKKVLIIHGKGLHSESRRGVLREAVRQALVKDRHVASWGEADRKDGGTGASWVWLKGS